MSDALQRLSGGENCVLGMVTGVMSKACTSRVASYLALLWPSRGRHQLFNAAEIIQIELRLFEFSSTLIQIEPRLFEFRLQVQLSVPRLEKHATARPQALDDMDDAPKGR